MRPAFRLDFSTFAQFGGAFGRRVLRGAASAVEAVIAMIAIERAIATTADTAVRTMAPG